MKSAQVIYSRIQSQGFLYFWRWGMEFSHTLANYPNVKKKLGMKGTLLHDRKINYFKLEKFLQVILDDINASFLQFYQNMYVL